MRRKAAMVRHIFERNLKLRSVRLLKGEPSRDEIISKVRVSRKGITSGGKPFGRGALYELLANPIYLGEIRHRKLRHPGQHLAIVDRAVWDKVHERLCKQSTHRQTLDVKGVSSPLAGKLFDEKGEPLYAWGANKGACRYRYYVSRKLIQGSAGGTKNGRRLPALEIERTVASASRQMLGDRPPIVRLCRNHKSP